MGGGGAERHDSASGSCIELDLRNCIEIDQIGRIESDKINLFVYFEEPQSLESLRPHSDCLPCLTQTTWMTSWKALASNITIYFEIVMIQSMHIETVRLFDVNDILGDWFDRLQYLDRFGSDWHVSRSISNPLVRKARFYILKTGTVDNTFVALKCCIQSCLQYSCLLPHEVTAHLDRLRSQLISVRSICDGTAMAWVHDYVPLHRWTSDSLSVGCSLRQVIRTLLAQIVCLSCKQPLRLSKQLLRLMSNTCLSRCIQQSQVIFSSDFTD